MKNLLLIILVLLFLGSCKREYECKCDYSYILNDSIFIMNSIILSSKHSTRANARIYCEGKEINLLYGELINKCYLK